MRIIGRGRTAKDVQFLQQLGIDGDSIIESVFTFDFKPQENRYTRAQLNLPENKFLIAVIGARLNDEVTPAFLDVFEQLYKLGAHLVFIGGFDKHAEYAAKNSVFAEHSTALGFQSDVLAIMELCDLYANPQRTGGGSSAAEALYKGVPVVTLDSGDVSVAAGGDFHVHSYEEMTHMIKRYIQEDRFYETMSGKARERAELLMSTERQFSEVVRLITENKHFA
ncbi:hypothetical protein BG53_00910 [Paenibacillus darwinianus]|uniref:Glycosyl transferase family 1 domain-containing protein n=1 Tax=Paenibacillus darwinianus TaxID=1380763 RepID=A0A9W5W785_9BACL|nr:glycosyltransferase [Paenibacillus darwinianus]EXX88240.1 hypothetical protein CH50_03790 [Paenibacillus darwinianus]EXX89015.1 hypothetical protein BG53_00910 [Paenibacillus darwinianus]EXX89427.1 hypothetical protein BG52_15530 [Paenibacillus darwinianus]